LVRVDDAPGAANLFRVSAAGPPLWHAAAAPSAHRVSLGLGVSDAAAARALDALGWRAAAGAAHGPPRAS
jgi:hypothetical protein